MENLPVENVIVDGEVVWLDEKGRSDFQKLQNSIKAKDSRRLVYYVFDLLFLNGEDYREFPLYQRKHRLQRLLKTLRDSKVRYSEHVEGNAKSLFEAACVYKLEGLISKDRESSYQSRRSGAWMKSKCKKHQEFVVGGFTAGEGARRSEFGALLLGVYEKKRLRYVGKVGTGFNTKSLSEVRKKLLKRTRSSSPFDLKSPHEKGAHWVKPELVVEVTFANWTADGILRTPVFLSLREDKPAKEVKLEEETSLDELELFKKKASKKKKTNTTLPISNPEKIFYKEEGITKLDVARYYQDISEKILPYISNRPLVLFRCPDGTEEGCFFQKRVPNPLPPHLTPVTIRDRNESKSFLTLDSSEGLLSLSQMGAFELHAWGSNAGRVEKPDQIIMDFDPGLGTKWGQVVQAAKDLKEILDDLNLKSYVKLTGRKGLHVHIPVAPLYSWDQIKNFAKTLGRELVHRNNKAYTISPSPRRRKNKIYIDYLRNSRGATAAIPYSLRASELSSVAMPISWHELSKIKSSNQFTLEKAYEFLKRRKVDPWKDYFKKPQKISILKPM